MKFYGLIGKLETIEGKGEELVTLLLKAAEILHEAPGCLQYIVAMEKDNHETIWITEIWSSQEEHDASLKIDGIANLISQAASILAAPPTKGVLTIPIGGVAKNPFMSSFCP